MTLFQYMEDFDNWELSTSERKEQLMEAVEEFNAEYGTNHNPGLEYVRYEVNRMKLNEDKPIKP